MGGKKCAKQFFQKHTNSAKKNCWEKIVGKKCEERFLYSHEYRDQKMRGIKREKKILPETHVYREQKTMEKNRTQKAQIHVFFINTRIS